jgi:hypothetical protein
MLRLAGAEIIAHENTLLWMATPTWLPAEDRYRPPPPQERAADETLLYQRVARGGRRTHRLRLPARSAHQRRYLRVLPRRQRARGGRRGPRRHAIRSSIS